MASLRSRRLSQRFVAVVVIAVFNAAWFFAVGCAALCAFGPCPQQHAPVTGESCHHNGPVPASQQDHSAPKSSCPDHKYLAASAVPVAAPDITPGLHNGAPVAALPYLLAAQPPGSLRFVTCCPILLRHFLPVAFFSKKNPCFGSRAALHSG